MKRRTLTYAEMKEKARQEAIDWQADFQRITTVMRNLPYGRIILRSQGNNTDFLQSLEKTESFNGGI